MNKLTNQDKKSVKPPNTAFEELRDLMYLSLEESNDTYLTISNGKPVLHLMTWKGTELEEYIMYIEGWKIIKCTH